MRNDTPPRPLVNSHPGNPHPYGQFVWLDKIASAEQVVKVGLGSFHVQFFKVGHRGSCVLLVTP
jgi:hypothetical protein